MARKSNTPIVLSQREKEFIDGALLGDGHITKPRGNSCQFAYTTSKLSHAEYVYKMLKRLSVNENKDGPTRRDRFDDRTKKTYISYKFRTVCNETFFRLRQRWYPDGTKIIPEDVILTPMTGLIWYIGDGGIVHSNRSEYVKLSTHAFDKMQMEQILLPQLSRFEPSLVKADKETQFYIYIPRCCLPSFFEWIGRCPVKEYEYKWTLQPYKYKSVELYGVSDYSATYPVVVNEWMNENTTIYALSKKYKLPIRCIKDELTRRGIDWTPIDNKKPVVQYDLLDNPVRVWYSGQQIKRELGFNASSISMCCRGLRKQYKGYKWKFDQTETPLVLG